MRLIPLVLATLILCAPPSYAEEWIEYSSRVDFFSVNFPGQPKITDIMYPTEYGIELPGRIYRADVDKNHYSVTVVDYSQADRIHAERNKNCKGDGDICNDRGGGEARGAMIFAAFPFLQRNAKLTHFAYYNADRVEGLRIQLNNVDGSQTYAVIHMHENRLYIFEGTVAAGLPPPALFQQSVGFLDKDGKRIRYSTVYSNGYPPPPRDR